MDDYLLGKKEWVVLQERKGTCIIPKKSIRKKDLKSDSEKVGFEPTVKFSKKNFSNRIKCRR